MPQTAGHSLSPRGTDGSGIRWRFCDGATLTLERRFAMPGLVVQPPRVPGFAFRIYCMAPSGEQLHFTFSAADGRSLRLTLRLNFHGWKEFCIPYERGFMLGHTAPDALCRLCIQAETGGGFSNILFRDIRLWAAVDALFVYPSLCAQVRHLACHPRRFPAEIYEDNAPCRNAPVFPLPEYVTENELSAFAEITRRYEAFCDTLDTPPYTQPAPDALERAQAFFRSMTLRIRHGPGNPGSLSMISPLTHMPWLPLPAPIVPRHPLSSLNSMSCFCVILRNRTSHLTGTMDAASRQACCVCESHWLQAACCLTQ